MLARFGPTLASMAFGSVAPMVRRARRKAIAYVLLAVFVLSAYAAGVVAAGLYVARYVGSIEAALTVVLAMIVLAVLVVALTALLDWIDRRRHAAKDKTKAMTATVAMSLLPVVLRSRPLMATAMVGGLAYVALNALKHGTGDEAD